MYVKENICSYGKEIMLDRRIALIEARASHILSHAMVWAVWAILLYISYLWATALGPIVEALYQYGLFT